mgnify:CR=1 FL=1
MPGVERLIRTADHGPGPARLARGAVRDFVLGVNIVNGRGEALVFGGQVMKNVAGYDVSRLVAGSLGTLGLIVEVSLKVLPVPPGTSAILGAPLVFLAAQLAFGILGAWAAPAPHRRPGSIRLSVPSLSR